MAWLQSHKSYPESARRDGVQGRVVVHFRVDEAGDVRELALVQSSGSGVLDEAALTMLRGAHLPRPPAGVSIRLPIRYSLAP